MTIFPPLNCTFHKTSQMYLNALHKYLYCNVKLNSEKIKFFEIIFCMLFEYV